MPFRSILPHEPPPQEEYGYLLLQGAFTPKNKTVEASPPNVTFWTSSSLRLALLAVFQIDAPIALPFELHEVEVLDPAPPYTKVRLVYPSPAAACAVATILRQRGLTPHALLQTRCCGSQESIFGSRPFLVTLITRQLLVEPSWPRSTPPKFRRLQVVNEHRARFVFLTNLATTSDASKWTTVQAISSIRRVCNVYDSSGTGVEVFVASSKSKHCLPRSISSCHVGMRSPHDAQRLVQALQAETVEWKWRDGHGESQTMRSMPLVLELVDSLQSLQKHVNEEKGSCLPRSECTSTTRHVTVPGLHLVPDFVSIPEEQTLLAVLLGPHAPWAPSQAAPSRGLLQRKVQHYGYVFDYATADVLRDRSLFGADCPALPKMDDNIGTCLEKSIEEHVEQGQGWEVLAGIIERTRRHEISAGVDHSTINQLTINCYDPGQGIGSHVDTKSAFGDGLISISLGGGIVMEFRKVGAAKEEREARKLVYLPPRSLLLMSGPARYEWEHLIVSRTTDTKEGEVLRRELRVSLTLRTALDVSGAPMLRIESGAYPPKWGAPNQSGENKFNLATPACERDHVHAVYDAIATQWHHTRGKRGVLWPGATHFLKLLPPASLVADVGCGDGKYFPAIWQAGSYVIGTDISRPLLMTAVQSGRAADGSMTENRRVEAADRHLQQYPEVSVADCMSLPLRTDAFDAAICIAVMHHLSTTERRKRCIAELVRIVRPGGTINIQAWAMEQEEGSRRKFAANDVYVPFNAQPRYLQLNGSSAHEDGTFQDAANNPAANSRVASAAELYARAQNAEYDCEKRLVVFQRYCHLYRRGELEELVGEIGGAKVIEGGFESGNYFVILEVSNS